MLSDESSSDSETGRFKCRTKTQDEQPHNSKSRTDSSRRGDRSRRSNGDSYKREPDRKRDERTHFERSKERHRHYRYSPVRRRYSPERSRSRRSHDRYRHEKDREVQPKSKPRDRSSSKEKHRNSRSRSHKSPHTVSKRDIKEEIKEIITSKPLSKEKTTQEQREKKMSSPEMKEKRSEVHKPVTSESSKKKQDSPIVIEEHGDSDVSEEVQAGSYYSMIPAVVKEKSEESSEIDSSDDERLRAKLLNLEKELHKTKKKKHKKKHKKKSIRSSKEKGDTSTSVEVTSTTDIQDKVKLDESNSVIEITEVTSTQKSTQKESSEEGEISTEDETQPQHDIDPTDLRHKLKRSTTKTSSNNSQDIMKPEVCGPALPPHLETSNKRSKSPNTEGPALPPHLQKKSRNLGPSIPENMRKVLAESSREVIKYDSSDEDMGIGPLPVGTEEKWSDAHKRLEERALDMKIKQMDGHSLHNSDVKSREKWMLELPEGKAKYLGLEARTFRAKEGPDMSDRSSWTDTPAEKARKAAGIVTEDDTDATLRQEARARQIAKRDDDQEKAIKKHKKKHKREESLLEMHQKKLKKKKKKDEKEEEKKERRPFSRDVDLQVNRFDESQKKSIIKKAQDLNTRFSRGEAKYL